MSHVLPVGGRPLQEAVDDGFDHQFHRVRAEVRTDSLNGFLCQLIQKLIPKS
jgi:hypothetical protein